MNVRILSSQEPTDNRANPHATLAQSGGAYATLAPVANIWRFLEACEQGGVEQLTVAPGTGSPPFPDRANRQSDGGAEARGS